MSIGVLEGAAFLLLSLLDNGNNDNDDHEPLQLARRVRFENRKNVREDLRTC